MLISDGSEKERKYIVSCAKDLAGKWTEENWKMLQCASYSDLEIIVRQKMRTDIICVDITMEGALELTKELRKLTPSAYIILIASAKISPAVYMRPAIGAESLLLKPLRIQQIQEVLSEALQTHIRRFYLPDEKRVFVIEYNGGRNLVDYENIYFFEAREKRVYLNTDMEEYGFYDTLDQLEAKLADGFIRCHRSYLINKNKIVKVFLSQNKVVLEEEFEIPLSRSYKPAIKAYLEESRGADRRAKRRGISESTVTEGGDQVYGRSS